MGKLLAQRSASRVTEKPPTVPELRDGDRLNTTEFMRRYEAAPEGTRAELINGVVYVNRWVEVGPDGKERIMPPISGTGHGTPQNRVGFWATSYEVSTPGVTASSPVTVILSPTESVPEPDGLLRILPEFGGMSRMGADDYLHGPPELLVEVSKTTAGRTPRTPSTMPDTEARRCSS